jgi:hypothetical protein
MRIAVNIPDEKMQFMLDMFDNLSFISRDSIAISNGENNNFLSDLEKSVKEVNAHIKGDIKLKSAWELADEL